MRARPLATVATKDASGTATSAVVLPANASREFLQIHNPSTTAWKFRFGAAPDANNGIELGAKATATYDYRVPDGDLYIAVGGVFYVIFG